ncbi:MAG: Fic family protein [Ktedonobacteraceae bacterium]
MIQEKQSPRLPSEFLDDIINKHKNFLVEKFGVGKGYLMPQATHMDARIARRLLQKKQRLDRYRPLEGFTAQRLSQDLRLLTTYHSNAIEGNTLSLHETQVVLEYGITVDGHPLREYLEATNHAEAFDTLSTLVEHSITIETVQSLHRLVMDKIDPQAGELRKVQVYIRGAPFTPPPARDVPLYTMQWVHWLTGDDALRYDPVTRAAIAHHDFEALHPFTDGNGRVGRLLLNLMLMQDGYPPALILREWRPRYIQSLQQAHSGNYSPLIDIVGLAVEQALDLYLEACVESTSHLLPLNELAPLFNTTVDYLGQLARAGKFEAKKQGQRWYASKEAVQLYFQETRTQPRGRPRK